MFPDQRRTSLTTGRVFPQQRSFTRSNPNPSLSSSSLVPNRQAVNPRDTQGNLQLSPNLLSTQEERFVRQYSEQITCEFLIDANLLTQGQSNVSIDPSAFSSQIYDMLRRQRPRDSLSRDMDQYSLRTVEELTPSSQGISNASRKALPGPKVLPRANPACFSTSTSSLGDTRSEASTLHSSVQELLRERRPNAQSTQLIRDDPRSSGSAAVLSNSKTPVPTTQPDMPTATSLSSAVGGCAALPCGSGSHQLDVRNGLAGNSAARAPRFAHPTEPSGQGITRGN